MRISDWSSDVCSSDRKRTCPKCGTRFYDLGTDGPVQCIECGNAWQPEPVLKSKQPLPFEEAPKKVADNVEADADLVGEDDLDIDVDDDGDSPDNDVDLRTAARRRGEGWVSKCR